MKQCTLALIGILNSFALMGKTIPPTERQQLPGNAPAQLFIENKGQVRDQFRQARKDINFSLNTPEGLNIFIGDAALHYQFFKAEENEARRPGTKPNRPEDAGIFTLYRMDVTLVGANSHATVIREEGGSYRERYYTDWSGEAGVDAASYGKITYKDIYPNIDWVLYSKKGVFKHEFLVHAGGKVSDIRLLYDGTTGLNIRADGSLTAVTPLGTVIEQAPVSWQQDGSNVQSTFRLNGTELSYHIAPYHGELVIDPVLEWSTYYGGLSVDNANRIATDQRNNVYFAGHTYSASNIATSGAFQTTSSGFFDACVVKFDPSGKRLWGTYFGGSSNDYAFGVATDKANNVYCCGATTSTSGIATTGAHQMIAGGLQDGMVFKFDSAGVRLWSTFLGGTQDDQLDQVRVDPFGNIYSGGFTGSTTAMATPGAYQPVFGGGLRDACLARFDAAGKRLWGTYFGGADFDGGDAIACDRDGNVYLAGSTLSSSAIATAGAHQTSYAGGFSGDAYLARFDTSGKRIWSTYYGGANGDAVNDLACDASDNIYLCGQTESASQISTAGAFKSVNNGFEAYLVRFDRSGKRLWGTYYGDATSSRQESGYGVATDALNNVYLAGKTDSCAGLATAGAYQTIAGGDDDAFLARFDSSGNRLWATYFGGSSVDAAFSVATDQIGNVYITGNSTSSAGIASAGAFRTTYSGADDILLAKFCFEPEAGAISTLADTVCTGATLAVANKVPGGTWISKTGKVSFIGATLKGLSTGQDTILYVVTNSCGSDTARKAIKVTNCIGSGISQSGNKYTALILPNPVKDIVAVQTDVTMTQLQIIDMAGRIIYKAEPQSRQITLDLSSFPPGVYCLRINGYMVQKLLKE
ncbi:MAG: SBBP repeat-containing protein [Chitinophagaceae bacterium]|jgi:hypothetical protein